MRVGEYEGIGLKSDKDTKLQELVENQQPIFETATVCSRSMGYGFTIILRSNDQNPVCARVLGFDGKEIGSFLLANQSPPLSHSDIVDCSAKKDNQLDLATKKKIVEWANQENKGIKNWIAARIVWQAFHPD